MKENLRGIVLATIRHSDKHNVTGLFTLERGRMSFLTPVGATKSGRRTAARLKPLSVVEFQANISAGRDLHIPSAVNAMMVWKNIYQDPVKATVTMFLSEFLLRFLKDAAPEPTLWNFIVDSVALFDSMSDKTAIANFHITFLIGLMHLAGIYPDLENYSAGMEFDMAAGSMVAPFSLQTARGVRVSAEKTSYLPTVARISFANSRYFRFSGRERGELLELILRYYGCHFPGCGNLKSLDVMREIFA